MNDEVEARPLESGYPKMKIEKNPYGDISFVTEDGEIRIANMCHSGFGVTSDDRDWADFIVTVYNAALACKDGSK